MANRSIAAAANRGKSQQTAVVTGDNATYRLFDIVKKVL